MQKNEIWYCSKFHSYIVSSSIQGLLIRGILEENIFAVKAKSRCEASEKAAKKIQKIELKFKKINK